MEESLRKKGFQDIDNMLVFNQDIIANDGDPNLSINDDNYLYMEEQKIKNNVSPEELESLMPLLILRRCIKHSYLKKDYIDIRGKKGSTQVSISDFNQIIDDWDEISFSTTIVDLSETFSTLIAFKYDKLQNTLSLVTFYPIQAVPTIDICKINRENNFLQLYPDEISSPDFVTKFIKYHTKRLLNIDFIIKNFGKSQIKPIYDILEDSYKKDDASNSYLARKKNELLDKIEQSKQGFYDTKYFHDIDDQTKGTIEKIWYAFKYQTGKPDTIEIVFLYDFLSEYQKNSCFIQRNRTEEMLTIIQDNIFPKLSKNHFALLMYIIYPDEISISNIISTFYQLNVFENINKKIEETKQEIRRYRTIEQDIEQYNPIINPSNTDEVNQYIDYLDNIKREFEKEVNYINKLAMRFYDISAKFIERNKAQTNLQDLQKSQKLNLQDLQKSQKSIQNVVETINDILLISFNSSFDNKPLHKKIYSFACTLYEHDCIISFLTNNKKYMKNTIAFNVTKKMYEFVTQIETTNYYFAQVLIKYQKIIDLYNSVEDTISKYRNFYDPTTYGINYFPIPL